MLHMSHMWYVLVKQCKHRKLHKKLVYFSFFFFLFFFACISVFSIRNLATHLPTHLLSLDNNRKMNNKPSSSEQWTCQNKRQSVGQTYGARNKHESIPIWFKRFILIVDLSLLLLVAPWHKMNAGIYQLFFDNNRFTLQFSNSETEKILRKSLPRH